MHSLLVPVSRPHTVLTSLAHFAPKTTVRQNGVHASEKLVTDAFQPRGENSKIQCFDLHDQIIPYEQAWKWQQQLLQTMLSQRRSGSGFLLLLQHDSVLTLGAGSTTDNLKFEADSPPLPLHRTERGGEVTYHGPGQLVLYPILDLQQFQPDLHWYLRSLEEVIIRVLRRVSGLEGVRIEGLTGVWIDGSKVAAVGIRARRWVTYHGLALNVTVDLQPYRYIVPCGIPDKPVTSIGKVLGQTLSERDLMDQYAKVMLEVFQEVFDVQLTQTQPEMLSQA